MSEAQKDILKMLSDNVITVDEAERLLKALNEGERRREEPKSRTGGSRGISSVLESVGETLADIGPMVKSTVEDVVTGLLGDELGDLDEDEFENVEPIEGEYKIKAGTHMLIINDWKAGYGKGALSIQGIEGNSCKIDGKNSTNVRVRQDSSHFVIRWLGGPLKIEVPKTITRLKVRAKHGDIHVEQIGCEMSLRTLAGNLEMHDLVKNFKAKTLGGHVKLVLSKEWQGNARAHTMGGDIELSIPSNVSLKAESTTMGGTIKVDKNISQLESKQFFPGNSVKVQVGEEDTDSFIALKSMGGDIELRRVQDE
jgi:DUF4097 and DUF4098 domain-containing protein YvlB